MAAVPESAAAQAVARALLESGAVTVAPGAPVTFKSGIRSPVYIDSRRLIFHPGPWHVVIEAFAARVRGIAAEVDVVAGVESAGIPHGSALAYSARLPSVFVRKESKGHGLGRRIEGGEVASRRVVLVEDMVTTGGSSLSAIEALRDAGAVADECLAIITYGFTEAATAFASAGVGLGVLTTFETVLDEGLIAGRIDEAAADSVRAWLADPFTWGRA